MPELTTAERIAKRKQELGYPQNSGGIHDQPFNYDNGRNNYNRPPERPNTLPANGNRPVQIMEAPRNNSGKGGGQQQYNNNKPYPLVQIAVPFPIDPESQIVVPVLSDYYFHASDKKTIRSGQDWGRQHNNCQVTGIEWQGTIHPYNRGANEIQEIYEDTIGELARYIRLVESGQYFDTSSAPNNEPAKIVYVDHIPKMMFVLMYGLLGVDVWLIWLLFSALTKG